MKFAVIFDMDGVLVDSTRYIWKSFNHILNRHGIHVHEHEIKDYLGLSGKDHAKIWKQKYGIDIDVKKFVDEANNMQLELMKTGLKVDKNLLKVLGELKSKSVLMGIGTSSFTDRANKILDLLGIRKYFSAISTAEEIHEHKPNPHIFLSVAEKLKTDPKRCVVIEDAAAGIEAAKRGEMKAIGYLTPFTTRDKLKEADLIVEDLSELTYNRVRELFD